MQRKNLVALSVVILCVGFYAHSLLLHSRNSFTLFPKNIPTFNGNYITGLILRDALLAHHSLPFWAPLFEGGRLFLEYPIDVSLNPFSLLVILFGEVAGMNLGWFLFYLLGGCSMFYLTRQVLGFPLFGAVFSSLVFSMSAFFAYLFENGIFYARELLLLPLLLAFFIQAKEHKKFLVLCCFVLALMCISTVFFFPVIVLFLFIFSLLESVRYRQNKFHFQPDFIKIFVLACLGALLLAAVKLVPMFRYFLENNRISGTEYAYSVQDANTWRLFLQRALLPVNLGAGTMYMGIIPFALAAIAAIGYFRQTKRWLLILLFFIVLSFGPHAHPDLHRLLWPLPGFNSIIEIAKYYGLIIVFLVALLAGHAFFYLDRFKKGPFKTVLAVLVTGFVYLNLLFSNSGYFNSFNTTLSFPAPEKSAYYIKALNFHQGDESITGSLLYFLMKKNIGLIDIDFFTKRKPSVVPKYYVLPAYSLLIPSTSLRVMVNPGYRGEAFFLKNGNSVGELAVTPHTIAASVVLVEPDLLVINQNFDTCWQSDDGELQNYNGLIALKVNRPETRSVQLRYVPGPLFMVGLAVSSLALLSGMYMLIKKDHVSR